MTDTGTAVDLSVVLPCYDEAGLLRDSLHEIIDVLEAMRWSFEVILVDDCSTDSTRGDIEAAVAADPHGRVRKVFHEVNRGRGAAVTTGIHVARGRVVGYIDIDLEVHARYIPSMVLAIERGADVATARRIYRRQLRLFHRVVLSVGYGMLMRWWLRLPLRDTETGYKFFDRKRILPVLDLVEDERWFWDTEVMARAHHAGLRIEEIPALFIRRHDKTSSVRVVRDSIEYFRKLWRYRRRMGAGET